MSPTLKRVLSVTAIILCGIVILSSAAGVIGAWATTGKVIEAGTKLFTGAEKTAGAVQIGLQSIDRELKTLKMILLPPAREEKLNTSIDNAKARMQEARDNSAGAARRVSDAVSEINKDIEAARSEVDTRSEQVAATHESLVSVKSKHFPSGFMSVRCSSP